MRLQLEIELSGKEYFVGSICGENAANAVFSYDKNIKGARDD